MRSCCRLLQIDEARRLQSSHVRGIRLSYVQVEQVEAPELIAAEVLSRCPAKQLMAVYKVPAFKDCDEFLQSVAFQRGKLLPGGIGDAKSAARVVLHDWHNGKIPYYTLPPTRETAGQQEAAIMTNWGEAFNADKVDILADVAGQYFLPI